MPRPSDPHVTEMEMVVLRTVHKLSPSYGTTMREVADELKRSVPTIFMHLHHLREKGLVHFEDRKARTLVATEKGERLLTGKGGK